MLNQSIRNNTYINDLNSQIRVIEYNKSKS